MTRTRPPRITVKPLENLTGYLLDVEGITVAVCSEHIAQYYARTLRRALRGFRKPRETE